MARNERMIEASPQAVFDVLADPRGYAYWVMGSREVRAADGDWPDAGSRFHHTFGFGPFTVRDHTRVEEVRPGRYLQLETKARPLGTARVKLDLEPAGSGTRVTMVEDPADRRTAFAFQPLIHLLMRGRNVPSLDRLAELAEGRVPMPGGDPGAAEGEAGADGSAENPKARRRRAALRAGAPLAALAACLLAVGAALAWRRAR